MSEPTKRPPPGPEIVREVRQMTGGKTLIAFSGGKDSIAAALSIRDTFEEVYPFFLYLVPDLEFIEETLHRAEKEIFGGQRIMRMPHPGFYRWLNRGLFQPPHHWPVLREANLPEFDFSDIQDLARLKFDAPKAYTATGVRAADSPMRHVSIMQHGAILKSKKEYFPVWDMKKPELVSLIRKSGFRLPIDYRVFGRSFDGLDARFMLGIKKHFPADYQRILEWFPLVEVEIFRIERLAE